MNPNYAGLNGAFSQQSSVPNNGATSTGTQRKSSVAETQWSDFNGTGSGTSAWNQTGSSFAGLSSFSASPAKNPTEDVFGEFSWAGKRPENANFGTSATLPVSSYTTQLSSPQPHFAVAPTPPLSYLDNPLTNSPAFNKQMTRSMSSVSELKRSSSSSCSSSGRSAGGIKKSATPLARMVKTPSQSSVDTHIPALLPPPSPSLSTFGRPPAAPTKQNATDLLGDLAEMFSKDHVPTSNIQTSLPSVFRENVQSMYLSNRFANLNVASESSSVTNPHDDFGEFSSATPATDSNLFNDPIVKSSTNFKFDQATPTGLGIVEGDSVKGKATLAEVASFWKATLLECLEEIKNARKWCVDVERTCPGEDGRTQKQMLRGLSKVTDYVDGIAILHQISRRISKSYQRQVFEFDQITSTDLTRFISEIEREWEGLASASRTIGFEFSNHDPFFSLPESHHTPPFCSLCLQSLQSASKCTWAGKEYHTPCGNVVIHRIQQPPAEKLSLPEI